MKLHNYYKHLWWVRHTVIDLLKWACNHVFYFGQKFSEKVYLRILRIPTIFHKLIFLQNQDENPRQINRAEKPLELFLALFGTVFWGVKYLIL